MNMKMLYRNIVAALIALIMVLLLASSAMAAGGIGTAPSDLTVISAVRQGQYEQSFVVMNLGDQESGYTLTATGDAGSWLSFFQIDTPDTPIDKIDLPAHVNQTVGVKIIIPSDAPDGDHQATIVVTSTPVVLTTGSESGQSVALAASINVAITVTGTQVIAGIVNYMDIADIEVGYPLLISVNINNTGNVVEEPEVKAVITHDTTTVDTISINNVEINPQKSATIPVNWDTTGEAPASYNADVTVSLEGNVIGEQNLNFKILPLGTLTRSGELTDIVVEGNPTTKLMGKVLATFTNTGQIATLATFTGEVYLKGSLVQTVTSDQILVGRGQTVVLNTYFKPDQAGTYVIKGYVTYEGKVTADKQITVKIDGPSSGSTKLIILIAVLIVVAVLAVVLIGNYRKIRQSVKKLRLH